MHVNRRKMWGAGGSSLQTQADHDVRVTQTSSPVSGQYQPAERQILADIALGAAYITHSLVFPPPFDLYYTTPCRRRSQRQLEPLS
jgi:hypothetical protein